MLELLLAVFLNVVLFDAATAAMAVLLGVRVQKIAFGMGPQLFRIRRVAICLLPFGGYVKMLSTEDEEGVFEGTPGAFDRQPLWGQATIVLSGLMLILVMALLGLGLQAFGEIATGFPQIFRAAGSPFGTAQQYLAKGAAYADAHSFIETAGMVSAKMLSFNLLPLVTLGGGHLLMILGQWVWPEAKWKVWKLVSILISLVAFVLFVLILVGYVVDCF